MTQKENRNDPQSPAERRASFIELTRDIEAVEHIGRHNRLFGRRQKIAEQLIAAGGNSEREFLPLLEDPSLAVRYTAAFAVKPFDRARFEAVLRALAEGGGEVGRKARSSLEWAKRQDEHPPSPLGSGGPGWRLVPHLWAWQASNPPPPALNRAQSDQDEASRAGAVGDHASREARNRAMAERRHGAGASEHAAWRPASGSARLALAAL
jgi:hypothetical protein